MSRRVPRWALALALVALAAETALAQEGAAVDAPDPGSPSEAAPAPAAPALDVEPLVDRLVSCAQAEGTEIAAEDRAALREVGGLLASQLGGALDAGACGDTACIAALAASDCTTLGLALGAGAVALAPSGPAPAWAKTYADALGAKILACYAAEQGAAPSADDVARVGAFTGALAGAFGAQTEGGGCTANDAALAPCVAAIQAKGCAELGAMLDTESDGASFAAACDGLLDCGATLPSE